LPLSQSQRGRDRCAPFFCCEKSKSYRLLLSTGDDSRALEICPLNNHADCDEPN
jgi:hypothetical protein